MRVLFATYSERTHFSGMVPLAWALRCAGHDVRVASHPALTDTITRAGLTAAPVGTDHRFHDVMRRTGRMRADDPLPFDFARPTADLTWEYLRDGYRQFVPWWCRLVNDTIVDDLVALAKDWRPDLVVWEPVTHAGAIAARVVGAAHARMMWSVDLFARMRRHFLRLRPDGDTTDPLADWLTVRLRPYGAPFSEDLVTGQVTIDHVPGSLRHDPALDLDLDLDYLPVRYVPYNGVSVVPPWLREPPGRPRVALTLGTSGITTTVRQRGTAMSVPDLLDALADVDAEVVVTMPGADLGATPANVRVVGFVPLHVLAPTCRAVIHHGGFGSYSTALLSGVPQLVLPNAFDLSLRAGYLARQGAGLTMDRDEVTPGAVRDRLARLLSEPAFHDNAGRLRAEARALPAPADLVPTLEKLSTMAGPPAGR